MRDLPLPSCISGQFPHLRTQQTRSAWLAAVQEASAQAVLSLVARPRSAAVVLHPLHSARVAAEVAAEVPAEVVVAGYVQAKDLAAATTHISVSHHITMHTSQ